MYFMNLHIKPLLGTIEKVDPRVLWQHEAHHFTPWLAENLDKLGDAIGIELELKRSRQA